MGWIVCSNCTPEIKIYLYHISIIELDTTLTCCSLHITIYNKHLVSKELHENQSKPQIYTRDPRPPILPPAWSAMGLHLAVFRFLLTKSTQKQAQNKCVQDFCTLCGILCVLVLTSDCSTCR